MWTFFYLTSQCDVLNTTKCDSAVIMTPRSQTLQVSVSSGTAVGHNNFGDCLYFPIWSFHEKKITLANRFNRKQYCIRVHNEWQRSVCKNCENAEKGTVLVKQILKKKNQRYFLGLLLKKFKIWLTWLKGQCREISGIFLCIKNSTWAPYEQPKRFGKIFHSRKNVCLRSA